MLGGTQEITFHGELKDKLLNNEIDDPLVNMCTMK
jgi:hypothetical protein